MTDVVTELIRITSRPMQAFGKVRIGADGTGFATNAKADWMNQENTDYAVLARLNGTVRTSCGTSMASPSSRPPSRT
jgi:hypothetical protein